MRKLVLAFELTIVHISDGEFTPDVRDLRKQDPCGHQRFLDGLSMGCNIG